MKRSRLDPLLDLSPVEIFGLLLVAVGVLCLLALTCTGCGGSPFEAGLGALPGDSGAPSPDVAAEAESDGGAVEVSIHFTSREAAVVEASAPEASPVPDAVADPPEELPAPEAAAPDAAPEAGSPPPDPACLRCSITCGTSQLSYTCAGGPFSCGHSPSQAGDLSCAAAGACAVGASCGLPGTQCWGGTVTYERGPSCP